MIRTLDADAAWVREAASAGPRRGVAAELRRQHPPAPRRVSRRARLGDDRHRDRHRLPGEGARDCVAVRYIDTLLAAFDVSPPAIFASGPYSGRTAFPNADDGTPSSSSPSNSFATFLPLPRVKELAWRMRIFGSAQTPGGDFNDALLGPTVGYRDLYTDGIARLDAVAMTITAHTPFRLLDPADQGSRSIPSPRTRPRFIRRSSSTRSRACSARRSTAATTLLVRLALDAATTATARRSVTRSTTRRSTRTSIAPISRPSQPSPGDAHRGLRRRRPQPPDDRRARQRRKAVLLSGAAVGHSERARRRLARARSTRSSSARAPAARRSRARSRRPARRCSCSRPATTTSPGSTIRPALAPPMFANDEVKLRRALADRAGHADRAAQLSPDDRRRRSHARRRCERAAAQRRRRRRARRHEVPAVSTDRLPARHAARRDSRRVVRRLAGRLRDARAVLRRDRARGRRAGARRWRRRSVRTREEQAVPDAAGPADVREHDPRRGRAPARLSPVRVSDRGHVAAVSRSARRASIAASARATAARPTRSRRRR